MNKLAPMANRNDRNEEAKTRFLREAVTETKWSLKNAIKLTDCRSYK